MTPEELLLAGAQCVRRVLLALRGSAFDEPLLGVVEALAVGDLGMLVPPLSWIPPAPDSVP
jgi:hypothetical protein